MKKKLLLSLMVAVVALLSVVVGAYAATKMTLIVNGKTAEVDPVVIKGVTYVPLRAAASMLGAKVGYDASTNTVTVTGASDADTHTDSNHQNAITVTLNKVVQDADSLRLLVTYTNNSDKKVMTGDALAKVVANGKQFEYISDFNFDRYYEQPIEKAPDFIEPGVTANSVIFFAPIDGVKTINVVLKANFEEYRFTNVRVIQE